MKRGYLVLNSSRLEGLIDVQSINKCIVLKHRGLKF